MRTLPTLAVVLAAAAPAVSCRAPVAQDLPPLADGCPGFQMLEPRVMASGGFVTPPGDYRDNRRIDYATIPANEAGLTAMRERAEKDHANMRAVTYLGEGAWDVRVFTWGRNGQHGSYFGNRTPDGAWMIETAIGQSVPNGAEVGPPVNGKALKGNLGSIKARRMNEIVKDACLLREPTFYDGGAPNGPGCARGVDYFIEVKVEGATYAAYQGCRAHGLAGEAAMILRSVVPTKRSVS
jgi:hypothetical protein